MILHCTICLSLLPLLAQDLKHCDTVNSIRSALCIMVKKVKQDVDLLGQLRKFMIPGQLKIAFFTPAIRSILSDMASVTLMKRRTCTEWPSVQNISLPNLQNIYIRLLTDLASCLRGCPLEKGFFSQVDY